MGRLRMSQNGVNDNSKLKNPNVNTKQIQQMGLNTISYFSYERQGLDV